MVVVGESKLAAHIEKAVKRADKQISRQIEMDRKAFEMELKEASKAVE